MLPVNLDSISESDLNSLEETGVMESRLIEFKQALKIGSDSDKKEFLADVSSLANASGGDLIIGVKEEKGIATEVVGIESFEPDSGKLKVEEIIRNGIQPRIIGCRVHPFKLGNGRHALVIRLPNSLSKPHMVSFKGTSRFYSRNSGGKYQLDVHEIRAAFGASEGLAERIRQFRTERIDAILQDNTPAPLEGRSRICLHLIPLEAFNSSFSFDFSSFQNQESGLRPIYGSSLSNRSNFDGLLTYIQTTGYVQLFRNGIIEATDSRLLSHKNMEGIPCLSLGYETPIVTALTRYRDFCRNHEIPTPTIIGLSLLNVKGFQITGADGDYTISEQRTPIDRDHLILPEVYAEDYEFDPAAILKVSFDQIWNACNFDGSRNYDEDGNWKGGSI